MGGNSVATGVAIVAGLAACIESVDEAFSPRSIPNRIPVGTVVVAAAMRESAVNAAVAVAKRGSSDDACVGYLSRSAHAKHKFTCAPPLIKHAQLHGGGGICARRLLQDVAGIYDRRHRIRVRINAVGNIELLAVVVDDCRSHIIVARIR
jgi:hypothetical protein